MYVHFTFDADSKEVHRFDVTEVGFEPSKGGSGTDQTATITNLDANEVNPKSQLTAFKIGDKVTILIDKQGKKEVVTRIRRR